MLIDEHVVTLDVAVHDAQVVHVEVDARAVEGNVDARAQAQLRVPLHVEQREETVVDELVHDHDVGDARAAAHEQGDVRVPQDRLHHDFVLNLGQQFVRDVRVENLLNRHGRAVEQALVDHRETALADLLVDFQVRDADLAHAGHRWKAARRRGDFALALREGGEVGLRDLLAERIHLVLQPLLDPPLFLQLVLQLAHTCIALASRGRARHHASRGSSTRPRIRAEVHPVAVVGGSRLRVRRRHANRAVIDVEVAQAAAEPLRRSSLPRAILGVMPRQEGAPLALERVGAVVLGTEARVLVDDALGAERRLRDARVVVLRAVEAGLGRVGLHGARAEAGDRG